MNEIIMTPILQMVYTLYLLHSQLVLKTPLCQLSRRHCKKKRVIGQHGEQLFPIPSQTKGLKHITPNFIEKGNTQNYRILL